MLFLLHRMREFLMFLSSDSKESLLGSVWRGICCVFIYYLVRFFVSFGALTVYY